MFARISQIFKIIARVAKLVDAPSSGGGVRKDVLVRIQSRALPTGRDLSHSGSFAHPFLTTTTTELAGWLCHTRRGQSVFGCRAGK